jgi:hypothetical protein
MRDLTDSMKSCLFRGRCPFCLGDKFYEGPQGGMSTNWYCANEACEAGFNIAVIPPPAYAKDPTAVMWGQVIREPKGAASARRPGTAASSTEPAREPKPSAGNNPTRIARVIAWIRGG